jgi:hypothetical protein
MRNPLRVVGAAAARAVRSNFGWPWGGAACSACATPRIRLPVLRCLATQQPY